MKIIGVIILSMAPVIFGIINYLEIQNKKRLSIEISQLVLTVKEQMRFSMKEVESILNFALSQPNFSRECKNIIEIVMKEKIKSNLVQRLEEIKSLGRQQASLLADFFEGLGVNDLKGQLSHCDYYYTQFEKISRKNEKESIEKSRLIIGLSLSLGMALFIMLI